MPQCTLKISYNPKGRFYIVSIRIKIKLNQYIYQMFTIPMTFIKDTKKFWRVAAQRNLRKYKVMKMNLKQLFKWQLKTWKVTQSNIYWLFVIEQEDKNSCRVSKRVITPVYGGVKSLYWGTGLWMNCIFKSKQDLERWGKNGRLEYPSSGFI